MQLNDLWYRPRPAPAAGVPLGLRSCGHYRKSAGWQERHDSRSFSQIFVACAGSGLVGDGRRDQVLCSGRAVVLRAGMPHLTRTREGPWEYRWFTLDGPLAEQLLDAFQLVAGCYPAPDIDPGWWPALQAALADPAPGAEQEAAALAYAYLARLAPGPAQRASDVLVAQALRLIEGQWMHADIAGLARQLGVHRSHFSRRFRLAMGMSPQDYLCSLRLQNACALLKSSGRSIADIAQGCGWDDPASFSRVFQRRMGLSPRAFRNEA
ncbi:MAG: AraC family transcriptional regulator [Planctomycetota bacterium]